MDENPTPDRSYNSEKLPIVEKTWSIEKDRNPGEKGFYLDLYQSLRKGRPLAITPESVRRQMIVLDQCRKMAPV